ncbi:hypothetical protein BDF20DRAFT_900630 [Mycotypha africana]|uniref:uncharacterized protein n=1 Tax=Mycotypha africana TaxID=64632 RepID=UPI0022FFDCB1|nr:uncharacterized protein BDF20DRAFT_900630 [Mycotypha africana]KAI8967356.1 hypothetical protein BDF20DRAFT_900630 [Mycotypha africana]
MCEGVISITHVALTSRFQISTIIQIDKIYSLQLLQLVIYSLMVQISTFSSSPSIGTFAFLFGHRLLVGHACVACLQDGHVIIFVVLLSALTSWRASFFTPFLTTLA